VSVFAIAMVRDEADVIASTVARMVAQVDQVLIADNGSADGTRGILEGLGVELIDDPEPGYYQSEKMSALAERAREAGAEWIVPFDADEVHCCEGRIADRLVELPAEVLVSEAFLLDHVATAQDPEEPDPLLRIGWRRREPVPMRKVACRARAGMTIHQGNHAVDYPDLPHPPAVTNLVEVRHFPYRSAEQFIRKVRNGAAAYAAADLPEDAGAHWRGYGQILAERGEDALAEVFREWFWSADPEGNGLVYDPCPGS